MDDKNTNTRLYFSFIIKNYYSLDLLSSFLTNMSELIKTKKDKIHTYACQINVQARDVLDTCLTREHSCII